MPGRVRRCLAAVLAGLVLLATGCSTGAPSAGPHGRREARFAREIERLRGELAIPGLAAAVVERGTVRWSAGFGTDGTGRPVTPQTAFPVASLTKTFAAVVALEIVAGEGAPEDLRRRAGEALAVFAGGGEAGGPVGLRTLAFKDRKRLRWDGAGARPLTTLVWYPAAPGVESKPMAIGPPDHPLFKAGAVAQGAPLRDKPKTLPLILLSHGTGGSGIQLAWLGTYLAGRGFLAAAVNHHGNTAAEARLAVQGFLLWWERPGDLTAILDALLEDPVFGPRIDPLRIGAAGFSLGGYTVISLAGGLTDREAFRRFCESPERDFTCGDQPEFPGAGEQFAQLARTDARVRDSLRRSGDSYRDARIRAVFAIAPALGEAFDAGSLGRIELPVQIAVGEADTVAPPETNARRIASGIKGAKLLVIPGKVGHYDFLDECTEDGKKLVTRLCADEDTVDRAAVHELVSREALDFFRCNLVAPGR